MEYIDKYMDFLDGLKEQNPSLIEGIQKAFNVIFESTEDVVEKVKDNNPEPVVKPAEDIEEEVVDEGEDVLTEEKPEPELPSEEEIVEEQEDEELL